MQKMTTSDDSGKFSINANETDTLLFQVLGYRNKKMVASNLSPDYSKIKLSQTKYPIKEVVVGPLGNYRQFKQMVLAYDPNKDKIKIPGLKEPKYRPIPIMEDREYWKNPGLLLTSPFSFLYQNFSKEAKSKYKYHDEKKREPEQLRANIKYNKSLVSQLTGLKEESEISSFMLYCNFSHDFIMITNEYDLCLIIKEKYKEYEDNRKKVEKEK